MSKKPKVEVVKEFNASPEKVFDAWLDPDMISQWMFGPNVRDEKIISLTNNPEPGGTFSYVVRRSGKELDHQGSYSEELDHRGTYREMDRPNRLVFTWGVNKEARDESVVTIEIEPTESGCRLTLTHELDPKWKEYADRTRDGWTFMLNKLNELLQTNNDTAMENHGTYTEQGTIRFERLLPGPIARVWEYLTDADKRSQWLAGGEIELKKGGRVVLIFDHTKITPHKETLPEKYKDIGDISRLQGKVTELDPPRLLSYTWEEPSAPDSVVTFELEEEGEQVRLTLTHRNLGNDRDALIGVGGGWHTHLGILVDKLNGRTPKPFWDTHMQLEKEYEKQLDAFNAV